METSERSALMPMLAQMMISAVSMGTSLRSLFRAQRATVLPEQIFGALSATDKLPIVRPIRYLRVQRAQGVHDLVKLDGFAGEGLSELGRRLDGARIGGPGGKDRSLFSQGHVRVVDHLRGASKGLRRVKELVEVKFFSGPFCHSHMLRFLKDMDTNAAGFAARLVK
jgi:hypothetical protein